ncbi:hypothetical protein HY605_00405 [Candidatus Peregrinibacteria bacterium]|nr:hypothetical protein [Candidatus Peregrinibacteria bacterium]
MEFFKLSELKSALKILSLDKRAIALLEAKVQIERLSWFIFFVPAVFYLLFVFFFSTGGFSLMAVKFGFWPLVIPQFALMLSVLIVSYLCNRYLHGHGNLKGLFNVYANFSIIYWLGIVIVLLDYIGLLNASALFNLFFAVALVWAIVLFNRLLLNSFKIHKNEVLVCLGLTVFVYFLVSELLGNIFIGAFYRFFI